MEHAVPRPLPPPLLAAPWGSLLAVLVGCEPVRTADYLQITFGGPAQVDVACANGGCETLDTVAVTVTWTEDPLFLADDTIEIAQYRIDYVVPGIEEIPFYAGYTTQYLTPGATVTFDVPVVGGTQRELLGDAIGAGETVTGSATLTLGGWDHQGEVIGDDVDVAEGQASFQVLFSDFSVNGGVAEDTAGTTGTGTLIDRTTP